MPLPSQELEARRILDGERTWLNLMCFERTSVEVLTSGFGYLADYSDRRSRMHLEQMPCGTQVPPMIDLSNSPPLQEWLDEPAARTFGARDDRLLCVSVESVLTSDSITSITRSFFLALLGSAKYMCCVVRYSQQPLAQQLQRWYSIASRFLAPLSG